MPTSQLDPSSEASAGSKDLSCGLQSAASCEQGGPICRLCWGEQDDDGPGADAGTLVSPCSCAGSLKWIHVRCLHEWQDVLRSQGHLTKAGQCEICKAPWRKGVAPRNSVEQFLTLQKRRLRHMGWCVKQLFHAPSWPAFFTRMYRLYLLGASLYRSFQLGSRGLVEGMRLGRALVTEHGAVVAKVLSIVADIVGTPVAQVLWIQAVAALTFILLSEFVYASFLGAIVGAGAGFVLGYVETIKSHTNFVMAGSAQVLGTVLKGGWKIGHWALSSLLLMRRGATRAIFTP